ncbi:hypothetical protein PR001_g31338 [Phytophthora rubi]|uniref:Uncharacterized protein n=1 Tax=Phytophthora rubi TaxID=129364 RepID=A0A6A3GJH2_9STRA|nr:hypothetical protein PR001_g31338 [Phytophthora rubi]
MTRRGTTKRWTSRLHWSRPNCLGQDRTPRSLPYGPSAKSAPAAPGARNAPTPPNVSTPGKPNVSASANQIVDAEACGNATANEEADVPETASETQGHATGDAWTGPAALDRRCLKTRNRRAPRLGRAPQLQRPQRA